MGTPNWGIEAQLARKEETLVKLVKETKDIEPWVIQLFAIGLEHAYPGIFNSEKFIEKCNK
jgi:hypothetical protein